MQKQLTLKMDKQTKNTIRYAEAVDRFPLQIYLQQSELPKPFPQEIYVTITTEKPNG